MVSTSSTQFSVITGTAILLVQGVPEKVNLRHPGQSHPPEPSTSPHSSYQLLHSGGYKDKQGLWFKSRDFWKAKHSYPT